jgi:peptidoglycan/xylan/chitin deacetylase (PgdA/CDA1 family)
VGTSPSEIELSSGAFERQLSHLAETERVLTIDQALSRRDGGVVVTFDDGTRDFHDTVVPLLVRSGLPATLYLATGWVGTAGGLTWEQVREANSTGLITVGSHTHSHANLARTSEMEAEGEMSRSKQLIEDELGAACRHFAYPWGVGSDAADRVARRLFDSAALDAWRTNRAGHIDPFRLGRVPVLRSDGDLFFRRKVAGALDSEGWLYRAAGRGPWGKP